MIRSLLADPETGCNHLFFTQRKHGRSSIRKLDHQSEYLTSKNSNTVVFIDTSVIDYQSLQAGVLPGVVPVILSPAEDAIAQITAYLQQKPQITTIHIVSHGAPGCLYLGAGQFSLENICDYGDLLKLWPDNARILLYGCQVAAGDAGEEFIEKLHQLTGAAVLASATATGSSRWGGDWKLEVIVARAESEQDLSISLAFCEDTLATYEGVFALSLVGKWDYLSSAYGVTVVGDYAYAVGDTLEIIDISSPTNPTFIGNYDIGNAQGVQVVGNYAYVADGLSGLQIIDISNPTNLTLKGNYDTSRDAQGVQVVGNYAYVADGFSGLQIIDISNPTTPTFIGNYNTFNFGDYDNFIFAYDVQVVGNLAYVADGNSGLQIIDISNPATPTFIGNYDTVAAYDVQVVGNHAYVADGFSGLQIIDISNPINPTFIGNYHIANPLDVQVVGNYAYVADEYFGLQIIDISDPATPTFISNYDIPGYNDVQDVQVLDNYAYVADNYSGLQIIDISSPTDPTFIGNYHPSGYAWDVQIVGNYAYVAALRQGLQIIDISNPGVNDNKIFC